jgi:hypothetical protein
MGLAYAALAFALGASGAGRPAALAMAGAVAVVGFVLEGLGQVVTALRPVRNAMPWHWLLSADPLAHGATWQAIAWPLALAVVLSSAGTAAFARRDLH